ncbi:MAG: tellurite methyltransferase [Motiliproteus sp.]
MVNKIDVTPATNPQQAKWNRRYRQAEESSAAKEAARVLSDNLHLLPRQGEALDLACGLGANALVLARAGLSTQAWDLSDVAIDRLQQLAEQQGLPIKACCVDLDRDALRPESFDVICVSSFLDRALCPAITAALRPGGILFYQTFTKARRGKSGPGNPDFLLGQAELLRLFSDLMPLVYREEMNCGRSFEGLADKELAHQVLSDKGLPDQAYLVALKTILEPL